ncbi:unnamed protein product [Knipowitschia caucasica]
MNGEHGRALFTEETLQIPFGTKQLCAVLCSPSVPPVEATAGLLLTHGAGGDMNFTQLVSLAHAVAANGFLCLRFTCKGLNLVYRGKAYRAVWDYFQSSFPTIKHIFLGGRSMGCRAAACLLRQLSDGSEEAAQCLICLSFPLHPPSRTDAHLQRSLDLRELPPDTSVLFVSGTRDDMCDPDLLKETVQNMKAQAEVLWLDGGSHGLAVKGRSEDSVMEEVNSFVTMWMSKQITS